MNHFLFMVLYKKANLPLLHRIINYILLITFHPIAFTCLCILGSSCLNYNCKVLITFHLGFTLKRDGPHTPCSHAKKLRMWLEISLTVRA
jgi:hypothetical protein